MADADVDAVVEDAASVAVVSEVALAFPLPLRPPVDLVAELVARLDAEEEEDTPAPTREGVDCVGAKVEDPEAGSVPGEARDLRLAEEGLEVETETAVAGVTGADS